MLSFGQTNYFFETLSPKSGFAFDGIPTLTEDKNGLLWFGTNRSVFYYNTSDVKEYSLGQDSSGVMLTTIVFNLYCDPFGDLWCCTSNGLFLFDYHNDQFEEIGFPKRLLPGKHAAFEKIIYWKNGKFLTLLNDRLCLFDRNGPHLEEVRLDSFGFEISGQVSSLLLDTKGDVIVSTVKGSVFRLDSLLANCELIFRRDGAHIKDICEYRGLYCLGYANSGLEMISVEGKSVRKLDVSESGSNHIPDNRVRCIVKRKKELWVGTFNGLVVLDSVSTRVITSNIENGLTNNSIYSVYVNKNNDVWIGTWAGGLVLFNEFNYRFSEFNYHSSSTNWERNQYSAVSFAEDADSMVWLIFGRKGMAQFNPTTNILKETNVLDGQEFKHQAKSIAVDKRGDLWIGTFSMGLWRYNLKSRTFSRVLEGEIKKENIARLRFYGDELWIATRDNGVFKYNTESKELVHKPLNKQDRGSRVWDVIVSNGRAWACTDNGLYNWDYKDTSKGFEQCWLVGNERSNSIVVFSILESSSGDIWIGTQGNGLFKYDVENKTFNKLTISSDLDRGSVYGIVEDEEVIWLSSASGIYRYDPVNERLQRFLPGDGISGELFIPNAVMRSTKGQLYFGAPNGFNVISPQIIKTNKVVPKVFLSAFEVNNNGLHAIEHVKVDALHPENLKYIRLAHDQNNITARLISNNYIKSSRNRIMYRLKNYQDRWVVTHQNEDISFTKIPPGEYVLEAYGSNNDNLWSQEMLRVQIKIVPPFWQTAWAYLFYLIIVGVVLFIVIREIRFRSRTRQLLLNEQYRNEANEMLHAEKQKFFTNISHEFRTPLNLIISPLNNLLQKFKYDKNTLNNLSIIHRNADRLLRLTNQILDFRLIEVGKLKVNSSKIDLVEICRNVYECFEMQIIEREIDFILESEFKSITVYADPDKVEKIVYNILGNAIKYSEDKGKVVLSIDSVQLTEKSYLKGYFTGNKFLGESVAIQVNDSGKGIRKEDLPLIFDRFSSVDNNNSIGAGIGLNLCQEYAKLIQSNISVSSKLGEGTRFCLNIPVNANYPYEKDKTVIQSKNQKRAQPGQETLAEDSAQSKNTVILIAEDNHDLRTYLKNMLSVRFKVLTAKNGSLALEVAQEVVPDLIITDIIMHGIDGIELVKTLKDTPKTAHIPIIVLTALEDNKYQLESISKGADSFLKKPIDDAILMAQITNILSQRNLLKHKYESEGGASSIPLSNENDEFLKQAEKIVIANLQNADFDTIALAGALKISKSTLYRKMKQAINQNSTEFIRDLRLKHAVKLMKSERFNMDEIGLYVGFNSTSYFNRSFKKKYGITPREYANKLRSKV